MAGKVHPQVQAVLDATVAAGIPKFQDLTPQAARDLIEALANKRREDYPAPEVAEVADLTTGPAHGDIPVRVYRAEAGGVAPCIVYYHGGGHVFGSLNSHDTVARFLCRTAGCTVISVDYRMGPEHRFPVAVDDALLAARWVSDNAAALGVDPARLAVAGDSAGGNLATLVALLARDAGDLAISAQCLIYPLTDYRGDTESYRTYATGYGILEAEGMTWFRRHYLGEEDPADDWRASPILAESLAGLPPALVITAECDVLHDEGRDYAQRLAAEGVPTELESFAGMTHGFFGLLGLVDDAERAHRRVAAFLADVWG